MDITVKYENRTYGTGMITNSYRLELSTGKHMFRPKGAKFPHEKDWVALKYEFNPAVEGYTENPDGRSEASVYGAAITMAVEEAEELANLLLYAIQHAKLTRTPVKVARNRFRKK